MVELSCVLINQLLPLEEEELEEEGSVNIIRTSRRGMPLPLLWLGVAAGTVGLSCLGYCLYQQCKVRCSNGQGAESLAWTYSFVPRLYSCITSRWDFWIGFGHPQAASEEDRDLSESRTLEPEDELKWLKAQVADHEKRIEVVEHRVSYLSVALQTGDVNVTQIN